MFRLKYEQIKKQLKDLFLEEELLTLRLREYRENLSRSTYTKSRGFKQNSELVRDAEARLKQINNLIVSKTVLAKEFEEGVEKEMFTTPPSHLTKGKEGDKSEEPTGIDVARNSDKLGDLDQTFVSEENSNSNPTGIQFLNQLDLKFLLVQMPQCLRQ